MVLPVVVRPLLDEEEIEPADKGSSENRFVLFTERRLQSVRRGGFVLVRSQRAINRGLLMEPIAREPIGFLTQSFLEIAMNKLAISLAVGASALFMTAASAAPLSADASVVSESNIQNVRMVCNENGRCWRERRVIIRDPGDSYGYAPRERYHERRDYGEERGGGIGFRALV
jgi:hypothetical protein